MHKFTKKRIAIGALGLLVVAGVAVAYFSTSGSGSGNAEVGNATAIVVESTTAANLYPLKSEPAPNTTITVKNEGKGVQKVKEVEASSITVDGPHKSAGCEEEWFKFEPVEVEEELEPKGNSGSSTTAQGTLWLENISTNQSACEGATVTVHYTST